jgi:predicted kinase
MLECVILIGLQASGKSTFFRERFAPTHDHISKDLLRRHRQPARREQDLLRASLSAGRSVVVDNTHATAASRAAVIAIARASGARVTGYYFETESADALRRNRLRQGPARVPDVAILATRKRLEPPSVEEGFDELWTVRLDEANRTFELTPAQAHP